MADSVAATVFLNAGVARLRPLDLYQVSTRHANQTDFGSTQKVSIHLFALTE